MFNILQSYGDFTLLEAELKTGRTHQIRVHLSSLGYAIAGDDKYGDFHLNRELQKAHNSSAHLKRMFLHAYRITFVHPETGKEMTLEAALPPELAAFTQDLAAGFERNQIGVYSPHVPDPESARSGASLGEELRNEAGMDDLFRSLASIFTDYDELSVYSDAARQGQVVLSVTADNDDKVERVIDLMKRHSPIDVSEQLSDIGSPSQWGALDENNASENKLRKANERANVKNVGNLRIYSRN